MDQAYEAELGDQVEEAEDICAQKDLKMDNARKVEKDTETSKKDLLAILHKGLGSKFYGDAGSWPSFRKYFLSIITNIEPTVAAATMKNLIECPKLQKSVKPLRMGREVMDELDRQLGNAFLNAQAILNEVNRARPANNPEEEKALVTIMKHAKRSLEMQEDPMAEQTLLTIHLLITWSQLLLDSSQDTLGIILQDSNYGKEYFPIKKFFEYLEKFDKRISVAVRHRAAKNLWKPKGSGHQDDPPKKRETRFLRGAYETTPSKTGGCTTFCKTGQNHEPAFCPKMASGEVTEATVHQKKLCTGCLGPKTACPQSCQRKQYVNRSG